MGRKNQSKGKPNKPDATFVVKPKRDFEERQGQHPAS
jgi:hypothetical protein